MYMSYCQTLRATCEVGVILSVFPKIESLRDLTKTAQGQHWLLALPVSKPWALFRYTTMSLWHSMNTHCAFSVPATGWGHIFWPLRDSISLSLGQHALGQVCWSWAEENTAGGVYLGWGWSGAQSWNKLCSLNSLFLILPSSGKFSHFLDLIDK